jgi:soluble epoxide hydrolase/lipid-phosphate phosphatase
MERALYKSHKTTRGLSYSYFFSPPTPDARTLLLLHGFPSTAQDWHRIVPALREHGLGVLAPDMLGYGGTDKPLDPAAYVPSLLTRDVIEIVNEERLADVVVVGHDWCVSSLHSHCTTSYV